MPPFKTVTLARGLVEAVADASLGGPPGDMEALCQSCRGCSWMVPLPGSSSTSLLPRWAVDSSQAARRPETSGFCIRGIWRSVAYHTHILKTNSPWKRKEQKEGPVGFLIANATEDERISCRSYFFPLENHVALMFWCCLPFKTSFKT